MASNRGPRRGAGALPGDLIAHALGRAGDATPGPPTSGSGPLPERERGSLDPQTVAEFLAFDVDFEVEPAVGFVSPPGGGGG